MNKFLVQLVTTPVIKHMNVRCTKNPCRAPNKTSAATSQCKTTTSSITNTNICNKKQAKLQQQMILNGNFYTSPVFDDKKCKIFVCYFCSLFCPVMTVNYCSAYHQCQLCIYDNHMPFWENMLLSVIHNISHCFCKNIRVVLSFVNTTVTTLYRAFSHQMLQFQEYRQE